MIKVVAQFDPLRSLPLQECERHYNDVHVPFIRHGVRDAPGMITYQTNLVLRQRDVDGGWHARPRAWRWATGRFDESPEEPPAPLPEEFAEQVSQDHRNFLRNLRTFTAVEEVQLDRRTQQTRLEKFSLHVDRRPAVAAPVAQARLRELLSPVLEGADQAFGLRLVVFDRVFRQAASASLDEEGQTMSPHILLPETLRVGHVDFYFDAVEWGEQFFADHRQRIDATLYDPAFDQAHLYHVDELGQVDKR